MSVQCGNANPSPNGSGFKYNHCVSSIICILPLLHNFHNLNTTIVSVQFFKLFHFIALLFHLNTTIVSVQFCSKLAIKFLFKLFKYNHCVSSIVFDISAPFCFKRFKYNHCVSSIKNRFVKIGDTF